MKEGIPPKTWNIIRASNYFNLYHIYSDWDTLVLLLSLWIKNHKCKYGRFATEVNAPSDSIYPTFTSIVTLNIRTP